MLERGREYCWSMVVSYSCMSSICEEFYLGIFYIGVGFEEKGIVIYFCEYCVGIIFCGIYLVSVFLFVGLYFWFLGIKN